MNKRIKQAALAIALLSAVSVTNADENAVHVTTIVSVESASSVDEWIASIAPIAGEYTREHGTEVCGVIARDADGRLGIVLGTTGSPYSCGFSHANVPDGFVSTGETFHTHPKSRGGKAKLTMVQRRQFGSHRVSEKDFSPADYADGPGYVLTNDYLLFQNGPGSRRVVTVFN